jgi:integrase
VGAAASQQDAAIYLTAAFTGLRRGELLALRWRDVDVKGSVIRVRASFAAGVLTTPKNGKVRAVPLAREVAPVLALLGQHELWTAEEDLVFPGEAGGYHDAEVGDGEVDELADRVLDEAADVEAQESWRRDHATRDGPSSARARPMTTPPRIRCAMALPTM